MALNISEILADSLLALCEEKPLEKISVSDIQKHSGVSRQAFYNHFRDKYDLIEYIYLNRIIRRWRSAEVDLEYYDCLVDSFRQYARYHTFGQIVRAAMSRALSGSYSRKIARLISLNVHQKQFGAEALPDALRFASEYHSIAAMSMTITWILSDMPSSPEVIAENITKMRDAGLSHLLYKNHSADNPYPKAANKASKNNKC